jgi:hypothetical protein
VSAFGGGGGDDNDDDDAMDVDWVPPETAKAGEAEGRSMPPAAGARRPETATVEDPQINVAPDPQEGASQTQQSEVPPLDAHTFEHRHRWFSVSVSTTSSTMMTRIDLNQIGSSNS